MADSRWQIASCVSHIGLFDPTTIRRMFDYTGDAVDNRPTQTVNGAATTKVLPVAHSRLAAALTR